MNISLSEFQSLLEFRLCNLWSKGLDTSAFYYSFSEFHDYSFDLLNMISRDEDFLAFSQVFKEFFILDDYMFFINLYSNKELLISNKSTKSENDESGENEFIGRDYKECLTCIRPVDSGYPCVVCTGDYFIDDTPENEKKLNESSNGKEQGGNPSKKISFSSFVGLKGSFSHLFNCPLIEHIEIKGVVLCQ